MRWPAMTACARPLKRRSRPRRVACLPTMSRGTGLVPPLLIIHSCLSTCKELPSVSTSSLSRECTNCRHGSAETRAALLFDRDDDRRTKRVESLDRFGAHKLKRCSAFVDNLPSLPLSVPLAL